jgi:hypothetical protein
VNGLAAATSTLSAGEGHTCALLSAGQVECWGWNEFGQLGDGSRIDRAPAGLTVSLPSVTAVAAGGRHVCALTATDRRVRCWGANSHGQAGRRISARLVVPTPVEGLDAGAEAVSAGARHTCALTISGLVACWGANDSGQAGTGTASKHSDPRVASGLSHVVAIDSGGSHTCAVVRSDSVRCWGANSSGQVGDGTTRDRALPTAVAGLPLNVAAVSGGGRHTCALTASGQVLCWGANEVGQLGDGTFEARLRPAPVAGLPNAVAIDTGSRHTCAITADRTLFCWGANDWGQLGDGTKTARPRPARVTSLSGDIVALGTGEEHTCAASSAGEVACWGFNYFGQIGDGNAPHSGTPIPVPVTGQAARTTGSMPRVRLETHR